MSTGSSSVRRGPHRTGQPSRPSLPPQEGVKSRRRSRARGKQVWGQGMSPQMSHRGGQRPVPREGPSFCLPDHQDGSARTESSSGGRAGFLPRRHTRETGPVGLEGWRMRLDRSLEVRGRDVERRLLLIKLESQHKAGVWGPCFPQILLY